MLVMLCIDAGNSINSMVYIYIYNNSILTPGIVYSNTSNSIYNTGNSDVLTPITVMYCHWVITYINPINSTYNTSNVMY